MKLAAVLFAVLTGHSEAIQTTITCEHIENVARIAAVIRDAGVDVRLQTKDPLLLTTLVDSAKWVLDNPGQNAQKFGSVCRRWGVNEMSRAFHELEEERKAWEAQVRR